MKRMTGKSRLAASFFFSFFFFGGKSIWRLEPINIIEALFSIMCPTGR